MYAYPIFLKLSCSRCLVVGAGGVGTRKLKSLLEADPLEVLVVDPDPSPQARLLAEDPRVTLALRGFLPEDCTGKNLVFTTTENREINEAVYARCRELGILCNVADSLEESDFIVPANISHPNMALAMTTYGGSPALTRRIKRELAEWLGDRYDGIAELLRRLRPLVLALHHETGQNTRIFRNIVASSLPEALQRKDRQECIRLLTELLPRELHPHIMELLHDIA